MNKSRVFDRVADVYDETRGGPERGDRTAADLLPWLVPGPVLEVCVGTGLIAAALGQPGPVFGVDLSAAMLARAAARLGPGRVVRGDALALPFGSSTVDNVVFVHALHVIGDVAGAIREAARVLRPGGRLVAQHGPPQREPSDIREALAAFNKLKSYQSPDTPATVDAAGRAAGLRALTRTTTAPHRAAVSPNQEADYIERRLGSFLWEIDDTTWQEVVAPVVARLRALPEPDRPRPEVFHGQLAVFTR
jgi:SAM-dependent methyltransferase